MLLQALDCLLVVPGKRGMGSLFLLLQDVDLTLQGRNLGVVLCGEACALGIELLDHENHRLHMIPEPLVLLDQRLVELADVLAPRTPMLRLF